MSVSRDERHAFSKPIVDTITLLGGLGVEGDAHCGATTQHRYLIAKDPSRPNLCQVHLIESELYDRLTAEGWMVGAGSLGENITTLHLDLMALSTGTILKIGADVTIEVSGRRSPCSQINGLEAGLLKAVFTLDERGRNSSHAGIMAIVLTGGTVRPNDVIRVEKPDGPFRPLLPV